MYIYNIKYIHIYIYIISNIYIYIYTHILLGNPGPEGANAPSRFFSSTRQWWMRFHFLLSPAQRHVPEGFG